MSTAGGAAINAPHNTNGCGNGAAGTVYFKRDSRLLIDNENKLTVKRTVLSAPGPATNITNGTIPVPTLMATRVEIIGSA